jgi:uncharacterized membrane protein
MNSFPKWLIIAFILISFIGFLDSTYLTIKHFSGDIVPCTILDGCEEVTTSKYSKIFGVPIALLGTLYYALIFFLSIAYLDTKKIGILKLLSLLPIIGFIFSAWFIFAQTFLIKAFCEYCILSAITSTLLFILGLYLYSKFVKNQTPQTTKSEPKNIHF